MSWQFERVAGPFAFTEGPAWDGDVLLFTDIPNSRILRFDPATGESSVYREGTNEANGLIFDASGRLHACEGGATSMPAKPGEERRRDDTGRRITRYDPDGTTVVLADAFDGKRLNSPNDLAFDSHGRVWFTDPRYGDATHDLELKHQSVYRLDPAHDGSWDITRVTFDTTKPNGLLVSHDDTTLYVAQSDYGADKKRELRAYPIHDDGTLGPFDVLHDFGPHRGIDGMCWDSEGHIVACAGWSQSGPGPMIYVFAPNGRVLATHPIEGHPTNCTFGNADLSTLYVTSAGCLYRAHTELTGRLIYPTG